MNKCQLTVIKVCIYPFRHYAFQENSLKNGFIQNTIVYNNITYYCLYLMYDVFRLNNFRGC